MASPGINPDAFAGFIQRADAIGKDIDAAKTAAFAPEIAAAGSFSAKPVETAFTVAGGVVRVPPLRLEGDAATIETDLQADLNADRIAASGTIAYQPGEEALVGSEPALRFSVEGSPGATERTFDSEPLAQFLTQRALEIEQARVEAMQAALLEKQRLRREVRYYAALQTERVRAAEEKRRLEEEARIRAEEEARLKREAEEKLRLAEEAWRQAEEKARLEAEAESQAKEKARQDAEAAERARLEADAKRKADAEARRAAEEAKRRAVGDEAKQRDAAAAQRRKADEAVRLAAEEKARRAAERDDDLPGVDLAPLSENSGEALPEPGRRLLKPLSIDEFFKSFANP